VDTWLNHSGYGRRMAVASLGRPLGSLLKLTSLTWQGGVGLLSDLGSVDHEEVCDGAR
jgi:hypothetical protein